MKTIYMFLGHIFLPAILVTCIKRVMKERTVRVGVYSIIRMILCSAKGKEVFLKIIKKNIDDSDERVREATILFLEELCVHNAMVTHLVWKYLWNAMNDESREVRQTVLFVIKEILLSFYEVSNCDLVLELLKLGLENSNEEIHWRVVELCMQLSEYCPEIVKQVLEILKSTIMKSDPVVKEVAKQAWVDFNKASYEGNPNIS